MQVMSPIYRMSPYLYSEYYSHPVLEGPHLLHCPTRHSQPAPSGHRRRQVPIWIIGWKSHHFFGWEMPTLNAASNFFETVQLPPDK